MVKHVFVYGTLRRGCFNSPVMRKIGARFVSEAVLEGYEMYSNGCIPVIIRGEGTVKGEVYELPSEEGLKILDVLEGISRGLYSRVSEEVSLCDGRRLTAFVYVMGEERKKFFPIRISGGDWIAGR